MAEERATWGRQIEFILALVGYAVGLGNVWRFPYLCYRSGGGAFLIPYVAWLILLGIPLFALEVCFGQFGGQGPTTIWTVNPAAKGIGMTAVTISAIVMIYYSVIIAWALRFLFASFTSKLPWEDCNSCQCLLYRQLTLDTNNETEIELRNLTTVDDDNNTIPYIGDFVANNSYGFNCSLDESASNFANNRSPSDVYFWDTVLKSTSGIEETGEVVWQVLLCNLLSYTIVFLVLVKGIESLGKVVYFTAIFPYILLTILLVRGVTLDGAADGVRFYLQPDWERLSDAQVWSDAAVQIFFSLSACLGGLIVMASYNSFNNNAIRDAFAIPVINCLTSFFAGFVVFSTLGYMAHMKNTTVDKVTAQGPGLIFVVYPEALSQMPVAPLWSVFFFFMVSILGFSSLFTFAETVMTSIIDEFPHVLNTERRRALMRSCVCLTAFLLGIPMVTGSGIFLLDLVDGAILGYPVLVLGFAECIIIAVIYGYRNFEEDIKCMLGWRPPLYFRVCWSGVTPVLILAVVVFKAYQESGKDVQWVNLLYWLVIIFPIFLMPAWAFYYVCTHSKLAAASEGWFAKRQQATTCIDMELDTNTRAGTDSHQQGSCVDNPVFIQEKEHI